MFSEEIPILNQVSTNSQIKRFKKYKVIGKSSHRPWKETRHYGWEKAEKRLKGQIEQDFRY